MPNLLTTNAPTDGYVAKKSKQPRTFWGNVDAMVRQRWGNISARTFLLLTRRFVKICSDCYGDVELELKVGRSVLVGTAFVETIGSTIERTPGRPGSPIDLESLDDRGFTALFSSAPSLVLMIQPANQALSPAFASVEWTRDRPNCLFFYSQDGCYSPSQYRTQTSSELAQRMFNVPLSAPTWRLSVSWDLGKILKVREGKISRSWLRNFADTRTRQLSGRY